MKKQEIEDAHLRAFWQISGFYPDIYPMRQEPPEPDFFLETPRGLIGIEHTQLIHQKDTNNVDPKIHEVVGEQIMQKAESLYFKTNKIKLNVHVSFKTEYGLRLGSIPVSLAKSDVKTLSPFIANFVANHIPAERSTIDFDGYDLEDGKEILPEEIESITISNTNYRDDSCWSPVTGGVVPPIFSSSAFLTALGKKNAKPASYLKKYAEIWLLMVENDKRFTSYFDFNFPSTSQIDSVFDRVFIYRDGLNQVIELRTLNKK